MSFNRIIIFFLAITVILSCAVSPTGRNQLMIISSQNMAAMGVQSFQDIKSNSRQLQNSEVTGYVNCVANAITRLPEIREVSQDWEVVVFDDPPLETRSASVTARWSIETSPPTAYLRPSGPA